MISVLTKSYGSMTHRQTKIMQPYSMIKAMIGGVQGAMETPTQSRLQFTKAFQKRNVKAGPKGSMNVKMNKFY